MFGTWGKRINNKKLKIMSFKCFCDEVWNQLPPMKRANGCNHIISDLTDTAYENYV